MVYGSTSVGLAGEVRLPHAGLTRSAAARHSDRVTTVPLTTLLAIPVCGASSEVQAKRSKYRDNATYVAVFQITKVWGGHPS